MIVQLIVNVLVLTYNIYMLTFLNNTEKYDKVMKKQDRNFRKAAVVITWIMVILTGLSVLALAIGILAGMNRPVNVLQEMGTVPMMPLSSGSSLSSDF